MPQPFSEELLRLVEEFCTKEQIHTLLKRHEEHEAIRLTGNKPELVNVHLRRALEESVFPAEHVHNLVRDAEENGRQFIYYYEAATRSVRLTVDEVGTRLFGQNWQSEMAFPRFQLMPDAFIYSDLRRWDPTRKPQDWVLKIYGQLLLERQSSEEQLDERTIRRTFVMEPHRLVIVVRWNNPGLLEIRVPTHGESKKRARQWLDQAWTMVGPLFGPDNFRPWDLCTARRNLVNAPESYSRAFRFSHSRLEDDDHNIVSYSAAHTDRDLRSAANLVESMKGVIEPRGGMCRYLRVTWLPTDDGIPNKELVTSMGSYEVNEVLVNRQCTAREIEYVTDQLRIFSRLGD